MNQFKPNKYLMSALSWALILVPTLSLIWLYWPVVTAQYQVKFSEPLVVNQASQDFSIIIPRLKLQATVLENIDPFDANDYQQALSQGIAHANTTGLPGSGKSIFLFGHSSANPLEITRTNTEFLLLGSLHPGDTIYLDHHGERFSYTVTHFETVSPDEVRYLTQDQGNVLILQTCTPIGTDWNRLLVFASPSESA